VRLSNCNPGRRGRRGQCVTVVGRAPCVRHGRLGHAAACRRRFVDQPFIFAAHRNCRGGVGLYEYSRISPLRECGQPVASLTAPATLRLRSVFSPVGRAFSFAQSSQAPANGVQALRAYGVWRLVMLRIFVCLMLLLGSTQAMARWTQNQRTESVKDCVAACLRNPNVQPTRQGQCRPYCECGVEATQKTLPNYQNAMEEMSRDPNAKRAIEEIMAACGRHFLSGSPEDSLRQISN
jgi:hypothetical protein